MIRPGDRLRALAARLFDAQTMERLVDPVVADLQAEYGTAMRAGRTWRSRWVLLGGYVACLKVIAVCGWRRARRGAAPVTPPADGDVLSRTVAYSFVAFAGATLLLTLPWLFGRLQVGATHPTLWTVWLVFLTPGALPLSLPVGATLGTALGPGGRSLSRRGTRAALVLGIAGSAASLATTAWLLPASQRAFSIAMTGYDDGKSYLVNVVMLAEFSQMGGIYKWTPTNQAQLVAVAYHARWAITFAPFVLSLLMLSVNTGRRGRFAATLHACAAMFGYYALIYGTRELGYSGRLPALVAAWLPNLAVVAVAAVAAIVLRRTAPRQA